MLRAFAFALAAIAFVPLDDRPVTAQLPVMLGRIAGIEVRTPPLGDARPLPDAWQLRCDRSLGQSRICKSRESGVRDFDRYAGLRRTGRVARARRVLRGRILSDRRAARVADRKAGRLDRRVRHGHAARADRSSCIERILCRVSDLDVLAAVCKPARSAAAERSRRPLWTCAPDPPATLEAYLATRAP